MIYSIHWGLVLMAAIVNFVIGWLWYGPLFGKHWQRYMGMNPDMAVMDEAAKKMMMKGLVINFVGQLLTVFVFFILAANTLSLMFGSLVVLALWILVGFQLPILVGGQLWEKRPWGLFVLNACYQLVVLLVAAVTYHLWG